MPCTPALSSVLPVLVMLPKLPRLRPPHLQSRHVVALATEWSPTSSIGQATFGVARRSRDHASRFAARCLMQGRSDGNYRAPLPDDYHSSCRIQFGTAAPHACALSVYLCSCRMRSSRRCWARAHPMHVRAKHGNSDRVRCVVSPDGTTTLCLR